MSTKQRSYLETMLFRIGFMALMGFVLLVAYVLSGSVAVYLLIPLGVTLGWIIWTAWALGYKVSKL